MNRRAGKLLVVLLLLVTGGAIVNVAVAWGFAAWGASPSQSENRKIYESTVWPRPVTKTANVPLEGTKVSCLGSDLLNIVEKFDPRTGNERAELLVLRFGWPLKSMAWHTWLDVVKNQRGFAFFETGNRWAEGIDLQNAGDDHQFKNWRRLPLGPLWLGFAINTIFYAAILWVVFCAPGKVRRTLRRRRGLCPACAYPIGTSKVCTECGKPV